MKKGTLDKITWELQKIDKNSIGRERCIEMRSERGYNFYKNSSIKDRIKVMYGFFYRVYRIWKVNKYFEKTREERARISKLKF